MVTSLAALERLKEERPKAIENCVATAGFSLGEITSLVFAGALPFDKGTFLSEIHTCGFGNDIDRNIVSSGSFGENPSAADAGSV